MKLHLVFVLAVGLALVANAAQDEAGTKELKKLDGVYSMVSGEFKGEKIREKVVLSAKLTIAGDKHTVKVGDDTIIGTHKLDADGQAQAD